MPENVSPNTPTVVARLKVVVDQQSAQDAGKQVAAVVGQKVQAAAAQAAGGAGASTAARGASGTGSSSGGGLGVGVPQAGTAAAQGGPAGQMAQAAARAQRTWWQTMTARIGSTGQMGRAIARTLRSPGKIEGLLRERAMTAGGISGRLAGMVPSGVGAAGVVGLAAAVAIGTGVALARWTTNQLSKMLEYGRNSPLMAQVGLMNEWRERVREFKTGNKLAGSAGFLSGGVNFAKDQWAEFTSLFSMIWNYVGGTLSYIWGGVLKIVNLLNPMHWLGDSSSDPYGIYSAYEQNIIAQGHANPQQVPGQPNRSRPTPAPIAPGPRMPPGFRYKPRSFK